MDIIENVKHGLVFYVFALMFLWLGIAYTNIMILPSGGWFEILILAIPFFLMGFFDKMLD